MPLVFYLPPCPQSPAVSEIMPAIFPDSRGIILKTFRIRRIQRSIDAKVTPNAVDVPHPLRLKVKKPQQPPFDCISAMIYDEKCAFYSENARLPRTLA